ncbi:UNVERIFIED_CONTAM: hypothetical protein K2H54_005347 [Gekko kuhli]
MSIPELFVLYDLEVFVAFRIIQCKIRCKRPLPSKVSGLLGYRCPDECKLTLPTNQACAVKKTQHVQMVPGSIQIVLHLLPGLWLDPSDQLSVSEHHIQPHICPGVFLIPKANQKANP